MIVMMLYLNTITVNIIKICIAIRCSSTCSPRGIPTIVRYLIPLFTRIFSTLSSTCHRGKLITIRFSNRCTRTSGFKGTPSTTAITSYASSSRTSSINITFIPLSVVVMNPSVISIVSVICRNSINNLAIKRICIFNPRSIYFFCKSVDFSI